MTSHELILISGLIAMVSGLPAALLSKQSNAAQKLSTSILVAADLIGVYAICRWWADGQIAPLKFPAPIFNASVSIAIDGLSAFFLLPILLGTALASIYGLEYWKQSEHEENGRRVSFFLGTDDFWRDYERMRSRGVAFVHEPREEAYGTVAVFQDLYGNRWDLIQLAAA